MHIADQSTRVKAWHLGHDEAVRIGLDAADEHGIAETVFLTDTGFALIDATSRLLRDRDVGVTVTLLPSRYFV